ncbi:MAG: ABC transporter permease [bacterium]
MNTLYHDLKLAVRAWKKTPVVTLAVLVSLAIGIGTPVTIFSYVNAVLLRPLPVTEPERLLMVSGTREKSDDHFQVSYPNFEDLRSRNEVFADVVAWQWTLVNFAASGEAEELIGQLVTPGYFEVLGVQPGLGRTFTEAEGRMGAGEAVVVLSHGLWWNRFGADPGIMGREILLNGRPFTVIGVMPPGFGGTTTLGAADLWAPLAMHRDLFPFSQYIESRTWGLFNVFGRLRPGVEPETAKPAIELLAHQLAEEYPANEGRSMITQPIEHGTVDPGMRENLRRGSWLLTAAAVLLLLIACSNVSILLINRGLERRADLAIRLAVGARRRQLVRQLALEGAPLFLLGGGLGLLATRWSRDFLWRYRPTNIPENAVDPSIDLHVLLFALGLVLVTAIGFGLLPALQASRPDVRAVLQEEHTGSWSPGRFDSRRLLVVAQVALAFFGLTGAGLFLKSFQNAQHLDPGFETERGFLFSVKLGAQGYDEETGRSFADRMLREVEGLSGVHSAALAEVRLLNPFGTRRTIQVENLAPERTEDVLIRTNVSSQEYFETLGIDLLEGREFRESDDKGSRPVAVVNRALAERFWNGRALGKRFRFAESTPWIEIVGVARDSKYLSVQEEPQPYLYLPWGQRYSQMITVYARTDGPPEALLGPVRSRVQRLDPELPLVGLQTMKDLVRENLWPVRMTYGLLASLGVLALVLSGIGIYAVSSNTVRHRTGEIGVRMAFGASRRRILELVLYDSFLLTVAGAALGALLALLGSRTLESLLYDVPPWDLEILVSVGLVIEVLALLATALPAWRATRLDPTRAIRIEG